MKIAFQLAYKNLIGAGLRTWLNVGVLSFAFIVILFYNGWIDGWNEQAKRDTIEWEYGSGHLYHFNYDPSDPFTIAEGHGKIGNLTKHLTPILIRQASIYPEGRMIPVVLKGIPKDQTTVKIPSRKFKKTEGAVPAIIGEAMARNSNLEAGDEVLVRWRDEHGTFDATTLHLVDVFENNVASIDVRQVYIPIEELWNMTGLDNEASMFLASENYIVQQLNEWRFESQEELLTELNEIIKAKKAGGSVMQILLLSIALLAIFDTQVLSVYRRQKEIGTYISLGMTRKQVVGIFTVEGAMNSIFAAVLAAIYGIPLFIYLARYGIAMPMDSEQAGMSIADTIYPVFSIGLILTTVSFVIIAATIVSYLPSRKIAKMDPVQALKGKIN